MFIPYMMNVMMCWVECGDFIDAEKMEEWVPNKFQLMTLSRQQLHGIIQKYNLPAHNYHLSNRERTATFIMGLLPDIKEQIRRKHFGTALPSLTVAEEAVEESEEEEAVEEGEEEEAVEGSAEEPEGEVGVEEGASVAVTDDPDIDDEDIINVEQNVMKLEVAKFEDKHVVFSDDINIHQPLKVLKETALDLLGGTAESRDGMVLCSIYGIPLNENQTIADAMRLVKSRRIFLKAVGLRGGAGGVRKAHEKKKDDKMNKDAIIALKKKELYETRVDVSAMDTGSTIKEMEKKITTYMAEVQKDPKAFMEEVLLKISDEALDETIDAFKTCPRAGDRKGLISSIVLPVLFKDFHMMTELIDDAKLYPVNFFEVFLASTYLNYDGTWNWNGFKETVAIVKKIKEIKERDALKKSDEGYMG